MQEIEFNEKLEFLFKPARLKSSYGGRGAGIYCILNLINGKIYIGSAVNIRARWRQHQSDLSLGKHSNKYLQQSYNKNGSLAFEFIVLENDLLKSDLIDHEDYWINLTNCCDPLCGYNICKKARSSLGVKRRDATKLKIANNNLGKKRTPEFKANLSKIVTGRKHSSIAIANMKEAQSKVNKRKLDKWPHELGIKCKCSECKNKRRIYVALNRAAKRNGN